MVGSDDPFLLGSLPIFRGELLNFGRGYLYFVDFFYGKNVGKYTGTSHDGFSFRAQVGVSRSDESLRIFGQWTLGFSAVWSWDGSWVTPHDTLHGTNISPKNGILQMIFLVPRWDMLVPWRVSMQECHLIRYVMVEDWTTNMTSMTSKLVPLKVKTARY